MSISTLNLIVLFSLWAICWCLSSMMKHYALLSKQQAYALQDLAMLLQDSGKAYIRRFNRIEGHLRKAEISSKVAEKMGSKGFDLGNEAVLRVGALEKSTHRVHFMPADQVLERNGLAKDKIEKMLNPAGEQFDWFEDMEEKEEA